jgi:hypothetical protein
MPTLRPQRLSGLVVIPTVEHDPGVYRVSIAIDVGSSRTGPGAPAPEVVTREDLVVELRNSTDGSFEPIGSPDPGPLPVRALRVVQARGEFTFGQGFNAPEELVVTLRGDRKTFPMAQTLAPVRCLGHEPKEGDAFPLSPAPGSVILRSLRTIWPWPWPWPRPSCCVRRFEAPLNTATDPAAKSEHFEIEADFAALGRGCLCNCCQYRQFVRGTFHDAAGAPVRFDLPSGPLNPVAYCEDGAMDELGPGAHGYYGHRGSSSPGDAYGGTGAAQGCTYRANERASCPSTDGVHLEFLGLIVDSCRRRVAAKHTWVVDL